ncbi:hypothetical protein J3R82DRAFT_10413 [Butyriboletus roseoflavus]|nr:hypothetical protein J3R82DRAFT_10413 [Butyriboletus roseoflavus]
MSDRRMYREEARPTLPPVRDLFRGMSRPLEGPRSDALYVDELSRSPRPPMNMSPPWIVPGPRVDQNFERSFSRVERRQDSQLDGPGVQRSTPSAAYYSHPTQQRYDGRTSSRSSPPDNLSSSMASYHSQLPSQYHARSTSQTDQPGASHDQNTPPGSHLYSNLATQSYHYSYTTAGTSSRGSYPEGYTREQYRESTTAPVAVEVARQPSVTSPSSLKYECEYCGKGFTRPSSLKV